MEKYGDFWKVPSIDERKISPENGTFKIEWILAS